MWDLSSPIRDGTCVPCTESMESWTVNRSHVRHSPGFISLPPVPFLSRLQQAQPGCVSPGPFCTCSLSVLWVPATSVCSLGPFPSSLPSVVGGGFPSIFRTPGCSPVSDAHVFLLPWWKHLADFFLLLKIPQSDLSRSQVVNKKKITCVLTIFLIFCILAALAFVALILESLPLPGLVIPRESKPLPREHRPASPEPTPQLTHILPSFPALNQRRARSWETGGHPSSLEPPETIQTLQS